MKEYLFHCVAFISGNFVFEFFQDGPNYQIAIEHSYFQLAIVLFIAWRFYPKLKEPTP